jgi:O-antigen biosynthesis protein
LRIAKYRAWLDGDDVSRPDIVTALHARMAALPMRPTLSVLVFPSDRTEAPVTMDWWRDAPSIYPGWELLLALEPPPRPVVDHRIRYVSCDTSADPNYRFNRLVAHATGEFLVVLRDGDRLPQHALLLFAEAAARFATAQVIYGDEDRWSIGGQRHSPLFKCDWNLELMRSADYINGAVALRRSAVVQLGGLSSTLKHAALYDLVMRLAEKAGPGGVVHVPHVLYHRHDAGGANAPTWDRASPEMLAAVQASLQRCKVPGSANASPEGGVQVRYQLPDPPPLVSIVIPTRNGLKLLRQCVGSILRRTEYDSYEIVIIDNGSDEQGTLKYIRAIATDTRVRVIRDDRPFNYSALNNSAVPVCRGSVLALVNNDIEVIDPGWLSEMVSVAMQPGVGAVGARLWYPDDTVQHAGVVLGINGVAGHVHRRLSRYEVGYMARDRLRQEFSAVTAACLVMRRTIFEEIGGLDETHLAVDYNDVDFCLRLGRAGYRNVWTPYANLYHHESATRGTDRSPTGRQRYAAETNYMRSTWGNLLERDPAYNANLALNGTAFEVTHAPRVDLLHPWFGQVDKCSGKTDGE